jgi:UDP-N-acetylmuramoylalanine--D-glutamate ligase
MKVAIAGYGIEGKASFDYWCTKGAEVTIADERDSLSVPAEAAGAILGADAFVELGDFDLIVRSPSINPEKLPYGNKVWSATNEFLKECPAPIIGVTGTKGKGTTSSLAAAILKESGRAVHLVGNIGVPAIQELENIKKDDVVVYEMSSFQLWDAQKSPHIAIVLMLEPDHLDVHASFEEYVEAKSQIVRHQSAEDIALYHPTNQWSSEIAHSGVSQPVRYGIPDDGQVYVDGDAFYIEDTRICSVTALQLVGEHNRENACAAISAALAAGAERSVVEAGLKSFRGLNHRLKFVRTVNGVSYYDDSIATTPGSAIAALRSFTAPRFIILGGSSKGAVYDEIVAECRAANATVIAIGQTGEIIARLCAEQDVACHRVTGLMDEVVAKAHEIAPEGSVVMLSPASASFDQYDNYGHRGDQFVAAVEAL